MEDQTEFSVIPGAILLTGRIICLDGIEVDVLKSIGIRSGTGMTAVVQTDSFTYNCWVRGRHNILRYCSAHAHRSYAHKHIYDPFDRGREVECRELRTEDEIPTLREVIEELQAWHQETAHRLSDLV